MSLSYSKDVSRTTGLLKSLVLTFLVLSAPVALAHPPSSKVVEMFPLDLGSFHQLESMRPLVTLAKQDLLEPEYFSASSDANHASPFLGAEAEYLSADGDKLLVEIVRSQTDSNPYSLFTLPPQRMPEGDQQKELRPATIGPA